MPDSWSSCSKVAAVSEPPPADDAVDSVDDLGVVVERSFPALEVGDVAVDDVPPDAAPELVPELLHPVRATRPTHAHVLSTMIRRSMVFPFGVCGCFLSAGSAPGLRGVAIRPASDRRCP